jgi:putative SOS response-associated peptidase YedK
MCGRYTLRTTPAQLAEIFGVLRELDSQPRYNIAPTQTVAAVRTDVAKGGRELAALRWGLVPSWAKDLKIGSSLINARAETIATKPAFRSALRRRRCLIPADGFYEWQAVPGQKTKQPWLIGLCDEPVFAFAGLWEHWNSPEGTSVESCTVVTTAANEFMQPVHNRMPVILDRADYDRWLDSECQDSESVLPLLVQFPGDRMQRVPVSTLVNSPRNDRPECTDPVG